MMMLEHKWPAAGRIVEAHWHGHHSLTDEGFVFSGPLSRVLDTFGLHNAARRPQVIKGGVETFKETLLARAVGSGARLLCRYIPHQESLPPVAGMAPQLYDRAALPEGDKGCEVEGYRSGIPYRVRAGETFTTLCINKPAVPGVVSHQHCLWGSVFAPDVPT